jgi:hypothetical protein
MSGFWPPIKKLSGNTSGITFGYVLIGKHTYISTDSSLDDK